MRSGFFTLCFLIFSIVASAQVITGTVHDEQGTPVEGATVQGKGTSTVVAADGDGQFSINIGSDTKQLVVSAVGFETVEVPATAGIAVQLRRSQGPLNEVVVVGYGQSQKRDVSGSISKVLGREIENQPVQSFESSLQGKAPGVVIENSSGKVGQGIKVRIRGTASISASSQPLYVIDGVPLTTASQSDINNEPTNPLVDLNPNDIESIEVLKDAAASAIYGARAANGVVLITTKKGTRNNKSVIEVNTSLGFSNPTRKRGFLDAKEYVQAIMDAARNDGRYDFNNGNSGGYASEEEAIDVYQQYYIDNVVDPLSLGTDWKNAAVNTNWENEQYRHNALSKQLDVSVRGGNEKTRFYASGFADDQEAIVIVNRFKRYGGRLNVDHSIGKKTDIGINVSIVRSQLDRVSSDAAFSTPGQLMAQIPISPIIDPSTNEINENTLYDNGLLDAKYNSDNQVTFRSIGNVFLNHKFLPWLSFRSEFGTDILNMTESSFSDKRTQDGEGIGKGQFFSSQNVTFNTNNYFTFEPKIGDAMRLSAVAGMSFLQNDALTSGIQGESYPSGAVKNLSGATSITYGNSSNGRYNFLSYFARANFSYQDKYIAGLSIRADGSSRFGPDNRYGYFPAVSLGWILSEESFLNESAIISYLKVRASAGATGNAEIGENLFNELYLVSNYPNLPGFIPAQLGDPNLKWEKTTQYDAGLEFGLFNNRLSGEIDIYNKQTRDLLLAVNVPATNGYFDNINNVNQLLQNLGSLENKGVEVLLNGRIIDNGQFRWNSSFNIAFNKNKIKNINGQIIEGGSFFYTRAMEGQPIGVFYMQKFIGVDPATGDALYLDENDKPTNDYNLAKRMVVGKSNPDFTGGFSNNFSYHNFDLSSLFTFVSGNEIFNDAGRFMSAGFAGGFDNQTKDILNAWKNPGDITNVPRSGAFNSTGERYSSRWLYDGSYIRLRQVMLGYTLNKIKWQGISSIRLYVAGMNLWTKTDYISDPEVNTLGTGGTRVPNIVGGIDFYTIPQPKTITFGLNVKF
jgi:TonB-linked SusC/RagA family outer membrane protein